MNPDTALQRSQQQVSAMVDGAVVAMRVTDGAYLTLDATGSRVWSLLAEPTTFGELCARMARDYDVDLATCEHDIDVFLEGLRSEGMVDLTTPR